MPKKSSSNNANEKILEADEVKADEVQARCFTLVDEAGKQRGQLVATTHPDGQVRTSFMLQGDRQVPRIELSTCGPDARIVISDTKGHPRVSLGVSEDGSTIIVQNASGTSSIRIGVYDDQKAALNGTPAPPQIIITDEITGKSWDITQAESV